MAHVAHAEHAWASVEHLHALELARRGGAAASATSTSAAAAAAAAGAKDAATARWHAHSRRCVARRRSAAAEGFSLSPRPRLTAAALLSPFLTFAASS